MNQRSRTLLGALLGSVSYYALARLGTALFALQPGNITILWLPIGAGVILVSSLGWRTLPLVAVAAFLFSWDGMAQADLTRQLLHVSVSAFADMLAAGLLVLGIGRFLPQGLRSIADLTRLVLVVALPAVGLSVLLITWNLQWGGYLTATQARALFATLLVADMLGLLLVVPGWMVWREGLRVQLRQLPPLLTSLVLMAAVLWFTFQVVPSAIHLVIFLLMVVALRGSPLLSQSLLVPTVIGVVVLFARVGSGPFAIGGEKGSLWMLLTYLLSTVLLTIGASLQHRQLQREVEAAQHWLRLASLDSLTGLANRRAFDDLLQRQLQLWSRQRLSLSLALLDIDHFKRINDQHGHVLGDAVLRAVAGLMREAIRSRDVVARFGGEEFAVLLISDDANDAVHCLQRLHQRLEQLHPEGLHVTLSAGLTHARSGDTPEILIARADALLYEAKQGGRNCMRTSD